MHIAGRFRSSSDDDDDAEDEDEDEDEGRESAPPGGGSRPEAGEMESYDACRSEERGPRPNHRFPWCRRGYDVSYGEIADIIWSRAEEMFGDGYDGGDGDRVDAEREASATSEGSSRDADSAAGATSEESNDYIKASKADNSEMTPLRKKSIEKEETPVAKEEKVVVKEEISIQEEAKEVVAEEKETLDIEGEETLDTEGEETLDTEGEETIDTEGGETLDTEGGETIDTEGETKIERKEGYYEDEFPSPSSLRANRLSPRSDASDAAVDIVAAPDAMAAEEF